MKFLLKSVLIIHLLTLSNYGSSSFAFKPKTHKNINKRMLEKVLIDMNLGMDKSKFEVCRIRLNRSQTLQDFFLPSKSKAHFDNCAFQKSINYINRIENQNKAFSKEYAEELAKGEDEKALNLLKRKILFNTGKILHASQDFYSHSNFVEIMQTKYERLEGVPLIDVWSEIGQRRILELQNKNGLISGKAWWVFPKRCSKKSPSHAKLAKDSIKYDSGKEPTTWKNRETGKKLNGFEAAVYFAEKSTYQFLLHTFDKYPMLKSYCGIENPPSAP